ncbi:AAA family ATPase [Chryseobacterium sp. SIMBA_028]|uniref:AAA family ATPase n=1 Tax=Chryseobacterium sp. SIMBA_028 TaxID=3085771 RepID=UPI00397CF830
MKNNHTPKKLYIITGGPGAGKTTLLNELNNNGFTTVPEDGRRIIKEQMDLKGEGLPWVNKKMFAELMFEASAKNYQAMIEIPNLSPVFFDRGILDTIGYLKLENLSIPKNMEVTAREMVYNKNVFILPPWKDIYENDLERKQTWEEAMQTFDCMVETYLKYDYNIIEVPKIAVAERVRFILHAINNFVN